MPGVVRCDLAGVTQMGELPAAGLVKVKALLSWSAGRCPSRQLDAVPGHALPRTPFHVPHPAKPL